MGEVPALPARIWEELPDRRMPRLAERLRESSLIEVVFPGAVLARVLVQELNMAGKPSLLMDLTSSEILEYWALLTPDQRAAFVADRLAANIAVQTARSISSRWLKSLAKTRDFLRPLLGHLPCVLVP